MIIIMHAQAQLYASRIKIYFQKNLLIGNLTTFDTMTVNTSFNTVYVMNWDFFLTYSNQKYFTFSVKMGQVWINPLKTGYS